MLRAAVISLAFMAGPALADRFVALAYDRSAVIYGFGAGDTAQDAQAAALKACEDGAAGNCKLRQTRAGTCVGLAVDYSTGGWGSMSHPTRAQVETGAIAHCASFGNENCTLLATQCAETVVETN
ncbi:MAG: DUF4189 domain-containing protein [Pseudomonadota bacterium]